MTRYADFLTPPRRSTTTTGRIHTLSRHVSSSQYVPREPRRSTARRALTFLAGFAVGVMLASLLFVATAEAQVIETARGEAEVEIAASSVTYTLHGEAVTLPRDIVAAAQIPRAQYALWDLDMLLTLADRQGIELAYMSVDDLVAMLDSVTVLAEARMAQIDDLRAALSEAEAERDAAIAEAERVGELEATLSAVRERAQVALDVLRR